MYRFKMISHCRISIFIFFFSLYWYSWKNSQYIYNHFALSIDTKSFLRLILSIVFAQIHLFPCYKHQKTLVIHFACIVLSISHFVSIVSLQKISFRPSHLKSEWDLRVSKFCLLFRSNTFSQLTDTGDIPFVWDFFSFHSPTCSEMIFILKCFLGVNFPLSSFYSPNFSDKLCPQMSCMRNIRNFYLLSKYEFSVREILPFFY